jgi:ABC-type multidrug transport system fused ATPase/permease subunit
MTAGLGGTTVVSGLTPVAQAWTSRLLINAVVQGIRNRAIPVAIPLPWGGHAPPLSVTRALIALAIVQFGLYLINALTTEIRSVAQDAEAVAASARNAGAASLIEGLPRGYDTALGKWFGKGTQLSGGQWQKVALARSFMRAAPIIVLDEPTSALDAQAEHELFAQLRSLAEGRTAVFISHRFSTVRKADRIFLFHEGRLAEQGTHAELMRIEGRYAELFTLQASAYID